MFCGKDCEKKWHLDCFEDAIIEEFGIGVYNILINHAAQQTAPPIPGWIYRLVDEGVEEGKRHKTRFQIYVFLKQLNIEKEEIEKLIWKFNSNCRPPESEEEVNYHVKYLRERC